MLKDTGLLQPVDTSLIDMLQLSLYIQDDHSSAGGINVTVEGLFGSIWIPIPQDLALGSIDNPNGWGTLPRRSTWIRETTVGPLSIGFAGVGIGKHIPVPQVRLHYFTENAGEQYTADITLAGK